MATENRHGPAEEILVDRPPSRAAGDIVVRLTSHPALFELMFAPCELHATDPELIAAQQQAIGALTTAVSRLAGIDATSSGTPKLALISWALVHGLVVLARDGALQAATTPPATNGAELAHTLTDLFTRYVGDDLAGVNTNRAAKSTAQ